MASVDAAEPRRSSIEKLPIIMPDDDSPVLPAFDRLPDEIIQQILQATDPSGFASLALLNPKWRSVAQQAHLYAHHLANCPSYSMSHGGRVPTATDDHLPELRRLFAREVKRNLFAAYLRPHRTIIKVISNSISSSSCPGGEGIQFSPSPRGHHLLAYNSSRIYVLDVRGADIEVKRELKILRRPAATCITDAGSMLAVLLTEMQVDIYDLTTAPPKRTQSLILDHSPRAIALSPCGSVLAAAYQGGIEVSSLSSGGLATDRRAVKCDAVDALAFSLDGTQILGTTVHTSQPNTVILTAPYYDPGSHMADDDISALWTTSILFPNSSRDCSHAVLIQNGRHEEAFWSFTYDRSFETFRAVRIDDLRNGTTYFTGPTPSPSSQAKLLPCTLPAASYCGDLVSAGFQGKDIWLYGVPEDLDAVPELSNSDSGSSSGSGSLNRRNSAPRSGSRSQDGGEPAQVPQWQILCDRQRNTLVGGFKIDELSGVGMVKWVADFRDSSLRERLVVAARGITPGRSIVDDEGIDFVDGGRLTLIDFDYGLEDGRTTEITVEAGTKEPEVLEEEHRDMETEVAIVRRRTVAQKRGGHSAVVRATTSAAPRVPPLPTQAAAAQSDEDEDDPLVPRRIGAPPRRVEPFPDPEDAEEEETEAIMEAQEAMDAPYSHTGPRSGTTLRRAATAAAVHRRLHPAPAAAGRVEFRRADGRAEHPHESDADNWVPPPPPYQKEDPGDVPAFLRHAVPQAGSADAGAAGEQTHAGSAVPASARAAPAQLALQQQPPRSQTAAPGLPPMPNLSQYASQVPPVPPLPPVPPMPPVPPVPPAQAPPAVAQASPAAPHQRLPSNSTATSHMAEPYRPTTSDSSYLDGENIYDISPPGSPRAAIAPAPRQPSDNRKASITSAASEASVISPVSPPFAQPPASAVPLIQTTAHTPTVSPQAARPPALDLQIPSPTFTNMPTWNTPSANTPQVRLLTNTNTWPAAPQPGNAPAVLPAGYPYSAPPADLNANAAIAQSYPPPPNPDQLASLHSRRPDEVPRRLSGAFQVPRVPVGSRSSGDYSSRRSSQQRPPSQQQQQQHAFYSSPVQSPVPFPSATSYMAPMQQQQQVPQSVPLHQPQPRRAEQIAPVPPQEDMPLIISTPKGVTGAFDPPDRRTSGRRTDPQIFAPVPRHPRPNTQAAVLRPTMDRLETIYSVVSDNGNNHLAAPHGPGPSNYLIPPAAPSAASSQRGPGLNRKQSRAERSAAKNMADAKRRGWTGRRRKSKRGKKPKEPEFDVASSAAWTDITTQSGRESAWGGSVLSNLHPRDREYKNREGKSGGKCAVM